MSSMSRAERPRGRQRFRGPPIAAEGAGGVFTESWFPACMSRQVARGAVIGRPFLDGRIVIMRDRAGQAHVLSAYCPPISALTWPPVP